MKSKIAHITLVFTVLFIFCVCGCGSVQASEPVSTPTPTATPIPIDSALTAETHPVADSFAGGTGTEEDPYQIETAEQLALLSKLLSKFETSENREYVDAWYIQTADITLNDLSNYESWAEEAPDYCWTPIGVANGTTFQGCYDGNGYTISGMYIYAPDNGDVGNSLYLGLFGGIHGAQVKNVVLQKSMIISDCTRAVTGGIVGYSFYNSVVESCSGELTIIDRSAGIGPIGGVVGYATVVENCSFDGTILYVGSNAPSLGGIAGWCSGVIQDCVSAGRIESNGEIGGIVGNFGGTLTNCENHMEIVVTDSGTAGGVVGAAGTILGGGTTVIEDCTNYGTLYVEAGTQGYCGGIAGSARIAYMGEPGPKSLSIIRCVNNSDVSVASGSAGGIVAAVSGEGSSGSMKENVALNIQIEDCDNYGSVTSNQDNTGGHVGGLFGFVRLKDGICVKVLDCVNDGAVEAHSGGGFCGYAIAQEGCTIEFNNCENRGPITGEGSFISGGTASLWISESDKYPSLVRYEGCVNYGSVFSENTTIAAGIVASAVMRTDNREDTLEIVDCVNSGDIHLEVQGYAQIGGILGETANGIEKDRGVMIVSGCANSGELSLNYDTEEDIEELKELGKHLPNCIGGIAAVYSTEDSFMGCSNTGDLIATGNGKEVVYINDLIAFESE